ncbi:HAMP domain-containing histidine kinase [Cytobacillus solani]|uniref:histidine kinase n=2 Tax=Cytobacillus solani TaxID=1637975 RepID=A0A0Q3SQI1_9BACI|nr:HAMP domain-containing sensor histidine kinase [Cytobacillus solani]KOP77720.1 histidine kinase [Bacillus sp. FJAT-21945]KQL21756.1 histidine kinase [Cytobacillus solani]USK57434.1 HAMP domain-containing histidine kinase [Cytobacillus solani]
MYYITLFICAAVALLFLTRYYRLKKEIKSTARQLRELNNKITGKKINLTLFDRDLEELAKEINDQIDETKRANAEKMRTENELKQAVANISHDIRTPMTSILGYIQLLESDEHTSENRSAYFEIVKNGALRLKDLLEDFFELSIIESADYPLNVETISLNNLVFDVLAGFYEEFNQRGLEPSIHIPEKDIRMKADSSAVKRVIENLVLNAVKHSKGNVKIQLDQLSSTVQLIISNPVHQLSEKDVHLLFDRFYKGDKTRSEKSTGLGLSIAKSLMLKMNGKLTAELKENQLYMKCEWEL